MKVGDSVIITQIAKRDGYYPDRKELLDQVFIITRIGFYWGGGWRALGLRLKRVHQEFYSIRVKLIKEVIEDETMECSD